MRLIFAFVGAALAPAVAMTLWYLYDQFARFDASDPYIWVRTRGFALLCLIVSMVGVMVLGIPAYLALRGRPLMRWWGVWLVGFVLAAIPFCLFTIPSFISLSGSSMVADGVQLIADGVPTLAGWFRYLEGVALFGACGTFSAAVFWAVSGMGKRKYVQSVLRGV